MTEKRPRPGESLTFDFQAPPKAEPAAAPSKPPPPIFSVAELGRMLGRAIEQSFSETVWVEAEVTGARLATSGHLYFCLKDEQEEAAIDAVMYRTNVTQRARALVHDGARVRVRGRPAFWAPRGKLSFVVDRVDPVGKGALLEALEKLKQKLAAEGLFARERKRPLPHEPRIVGVVSSVTGAVIHDIATVAFRRGGARILLAPAQVQGAGAVEAVRRALRMLQKVPEVDVIIVARGGGSQDDLLAFHDEDLVREVVACRVPVISAIGHDVDVTLVDFAADARAATPSQAAEMVVPDARARLRLLHERTQGLARAMRSRLAKDHVDLTRRAARLSASHPRERIARDDANVKRLGARVVELTRARLSRKDAELARLAGGLDAMSPLHVLGRGYAIAEHADGRAVRAASELKTGDRVRVRVAAGAFEADVTRVEPES